MATIPLFDIEITTAEGILKINRIHEIELESDWSKMSDTGLLKLPRKAFGGNSQTPILNLITTGCKAVVKLGYMANNIPVNERFVTEFIGYVSKSPLPTAPIEIELEDEFYKLKRKNVKGKTFRGSTKLIDVLKYIANEYELDVIDASLSSNFIVPTGSVAAVLNKIKETFGFTSFFRLVPDKTKPEGARQILVVGKSYSSKDLQALTPADDILLEYGKNIITSNLKWQSANETRVKIQVPVKITNAKDYTYQIGDEDGVVIKTKELTNASEEAVKRFAESELKRFKTDRFTGDVECFGFPFLRHGRIIKFEDWRYKLSSEKKRYYIDKTKVVSGVNGYRRTVTLGWSANPQNQNREI
jgi:hypothetical protein